MKKRPKVGIGVCVIKDSKVLLGKRKNTHGTGEWCFPGGHLEFNESWEDCAIRETMEETGIEIKNVRFATVTNDFFPVEKEHYVTIFMVADYDLGEARVMEPDKCEVWKWFDWNTPPKPLFIATENFYKSGYSPFNFSSN